MTYFSDDLEKRFLETENLKGRRTDSQRFPKSLKKKNEASRGTSISEVSSNERKGGKGGKTVK